MVNADPPSPGALTEIRTVELVEDDPSLQAALAMALRQQGYEVRIYASRDHFELTRRPRDPAWCCWTCGSLAALGWRSATVCGDRAATPR